MRRRRLLIGGILLAFAIIGLFTVAAHGTTVSILEPKGPIATQQRNLIFTALTLSLIVVLPVFGLLFGFAWKYRATSKATYTPDWDHNKYAETVWWGIPLVLIAILAVITWNSTHALDPTRPLQSRQQPLSVQVVALEWKWLFIYPEQGIASVNYLPLPIDRPVHFTITADAPMNSFWIPQLGGQIYAMPGMTTQLNLMASQPGDYRGLSANLSGDGFAGMHFITHATRPADFEKWVTNTQRLPRELSNQSYEELAQKSQNDPVSYYGKVTPGLYNTVVNKYMGHDMSDSKATVMEAH